jgi:rhodanese-related sulfurtransferase
MTVVTKSQVEKHKDEWNIIDVRETDEFAAGHIKRAINIPLSTFEEYTHLTKDEFLSQFSLEDKPLCVYCYSGGRSAAIIPFLTKKGFTAHNYVGSYQDWII